LDKWVLSKAEKLTRKVNEAMEKCQYNVAEEEIRNFTWHLFCDYYIEAVKDKLYNPDVYGEEKKLASQYTLYKVLHRVLQLLAPITPHLTEEIYQAMYAEDKGFKSLQVSPWPKYDPEMENEAVEKNGDLVMAIMSSVRQDKAENKLPLNAPVKTLDVYAGSAETANVINSVKDDIAGTLKIAEVKVHPEKQGDCKQVSPYDVSFQIEYEQGDKDAGES
jgi:valyl-tRNA synthetase